MIARKLPLLATHLWAGSRSTRDRPLVDDDSQQRTFSQPAYEDVGNQTARELPRHLPSGHGFWTALPAAGHVGIQKAKGGGVISRGRFAVVPNPVDYRTRPADLRRPVATRAQGLDVAAHERLGPLVYRLTGKASDLLPSADQ